MNLGGFFTRATAFGRDTDQINNGLFVEIHTSSLLFWPYSPPHKAFFDRLWGYFKYFRDFFVSKPFHVHIIGLYRKFLKKSMLFSSVLLTNTLRFSMMFFKEKPNEPNHRRPARQIKLDLQAGMRNCDVARKYGIKKHIVEHIKNGHTWAWLQIGVSA